MFDILTIGYLARDLSLQVNEFPKPNAEIIAQSFTESHGGACGNVAAYASFTFRRKCSIRCVVGDDATGYTLVNRLSDRDGVDVRNVLVINNDVTTTIVLVTNKRGDKIFYTYPGCSSRVSLELLLGGIVFDGVRFVYVAPCHPEMAFRTIETAHQAGQTIAYNPGTTLLSKEDIETFNQVLPYVDYLFLNKEESQRYSGEDILAKVVAHYLDNGVRVLIITDGHNGSIVARQSEIFFQPALAVDEVEPLGPGDAYASAFLACLCEKNDLKQAALRGSQLGAYVVTRYGVREDIPTFAKLMDFCRSLTWRKYQVIASHKVYEWPIEEYE
jgi:sugar/nucleoside kinase (ribokinase family)